MLLSLPPHVLLHRDSTEERNQKPYKFLEDPAHESPLGRMPSHSKAFLPMLSLPSLTHHPLHQGPMHVPQMTGMWHARPNLAGACRQAHQVLLNGDLAHQSLQLLLQLSARLGLPSKLLAQAADLAAHVAHGILQRWELVLRTTNSEMVDAC
jgi:hypothetical protein